MTAKFRNADYSSGKLHRVPASQPATTPSPVYARLPLAPRNASPVPHLTSLYHFYRAGEYGDRSYPGNCGGKLIRDLLQFFRSQNVFDPMTGSGTCADVCRELAIPCLSRDIRDGFDATDADCFRSLPAGAAFDFVWAHGEFICFSPSSGCRCWCWPGCSAAGCAGNSPINHTSGLASAS